MKMSLSRLLFVTLFCIASFVITECRMGWKSNGTEYFVYSANTSSFRRTNSLNITGKFSITPGTRRSQLVAVTDKNFVNRKIYLFEVYISGQVTTVVPEGRYAGSDSVSVPNIGSGSVFDFTITVTQSQDNGTYNHTLKIEVRGLSSQINYTVVTKDNIKWDLDKMKLFVGGYSNSAARVSTTYFYGCLSNVMFQGVDIIATYFRQYPNNTNPVRGSVGSPPYANQLQNCNDVTSTVAPTASTSPTPSASSIAKTSPTKKPGAAASYKASVFILAVAFLFPLFSF